jgi:hypothetical protein
VYVASGLMLGLQDWKVNAAQHPFSGLFSFSILSFNISFFFLNWLYDFLRFLFYRVIQILLFESRVLQVNPSWLSLYYSNYMLIMLNWIGSDWFFFFFIQFYVSKGFIPKLYWWFYLFIYIFFLMIMIARYTNYFKTYIWGVLRGIASAV